MSRPRVPEPAYGAQPPPSVDSRDSHGASSLHDNAQRLYYDDEEVEQPQNQHDRRPSYNYPTDQPQPSYNHREQSYDPYGATASLNLTLNPFFPLTPME